MLESIFLHHLSFQEVAKRNGLNPLTVFRGIKKGIDGLMKFQAESSQG